jgi:hypothetical protein
MGRFKMFFQTLLSLSQTATGLAIVSSIYWAFQRLILALNGLIGTRRIWIKRI